MTTVLGRERTADDLAPQAVAGELVHELDMLVRWMHTSDGGWFDVLFSLAEEEGEGAGRGQEGALALVDAVASSCRVRHGASIFAGTGGAKQQQ